MFSRFSTSQPSFFQTKLPLYLTFLHGEADCYLFFFVTVSFFHLIKSIIIIIVIYYKFLIINIIIIINSKLKIFKHYIPPPYNYSGVFYKDVTGVFYKDDTGVFYKDVTAKRTDLRKSGPLRLESSI